MATLFTLVVVLLFRFLFAIGNEFASRDASDVRVFRSSVSLSAVDDHGRIHPTQGLSIESHLEWQQAFLFVESLQFIPHQARFSNFTVTVKSTRMKYMYMILRLA
jgi:hypothetical protein